MSINITDKPEMNVVNVGDEISTDQLAAIQNSVVPNSSNFFVTNNSTPSLNGVNLPNGTSLAVGTFDNGLGGYNGISVNCAVGYELNWQAGRLCSTPDGGITKVPIILDSNLTFPDGTTQSTAYTGGGGGGNPFNQSLNTTDSPTFVSGVNGTSNVSIGTVQDDSGFMNTAGINVEMIYGPAYKTVISGEYVKVSNTSGSTALLSTGIRFPDGSTQTTAATGGGGGGSSISFSGFGSTNQLSMGMTNDGIYITDTLIDSVFGGPRSISLNWGLGSYGGFTGLSWNDSYGSTGNYNFDGFELCKPNGTSPMFVLNPAQGFLLKNNSIGTQLQIQSNGITFPDGTYQSTAYTGGGGLSILHLNGDGYVTNNYNTYSVAPQGTDSNLPIDLSSRPVGTRFEVTNTGTVGGSVYISDPNGPFWNTFHIQGDATPTNAVFISGGVTKTFTWLETGDVNEPYRWFVR